MPTISFTVAGIVMLGFYLVMIAVALGWLRWLRWRGLVVLGALTYPLYLMHAQLSRVVLTRFHDALAPWLLLALLVAGALLLAFAVNRLVERPVAARLRRGLQASFAQIRAADPKRPEIVIVEHREGYNPHDLPRSGSETLSGETRAVGADPPRPGRPGSPPAPRSPSGSP